ncbi:DEAD/DEAH box helicase domain-containing protein [Phanerochaete sordida]|uniref:ATP-dependent DNA helicase n=1 Tax=Phanerochaete sordida TaxID=48140 RepID=A0A9P3GCU7_9APHY|nr:DEAD/DEAH box helicase domain-containing protein [Phanerochaete sordida]
MPRLKRKNYELAYYATQPQPGECNEMKRPKFVRALSHVIDAHIIRPGSRLATRFPFSSPFSRSPSLLQTMSSSDEYFYDEIDSAILAQVDAVEAAYKATQAKAPAAPSRPPQKAPPPEREVIEIDDSYDYGSFDIDDKDLEIIDKICEEAYKKKPAAPVAGPSRVTSGLQRTTSAATVQTTLFGGVVQNKPQPPSRQPVQRADSNSNNLFKGDPKKTKQWDHTAFAKTGWKKPKPAKGKEKAGSFADGEEEDDWGEEEEVEFEQFPAPFISLGPPPEMKLKPDLLNARRWLYPLNQPKRDYQFNIVRRCLFDNTLVALPTGLGKTFIAGVVMLNFYTWFPEGKVVFVAPTKPLVAQQIEACHKTCGIPGSDAVELTGQNPKPYRVKAWQEKRVFYMTPQTLINDLTKGNCDPRDIVLFVVDEAHKGTGDYAYAQVIRYMMAKNPHFRVLALTATPGGKPEAVQAIVDALHISHVEIRDEQSLDLVQYLHKKHIRQHVIHMNDDVGKIRDMLSRVMEPMITKLFSAKILHHKPTPLCLHPFSCQMALNEISKRRDAQWAFGTLSKLGSLARLMGYLIEGSLEQCYDTLKELSTNVNEVGKQATTKAKSDRFSKDEKLQAVLAELERMRARPGGFGPHPKMDKLKTLLVEHFAQKGLDNAEAGGTGDLDSDSRVMVFTSFRQSVELITEALNKDKPLIRAVPFIGQGVDKNGKKGYGQKEQLDIIKRFKAGEFNVLVSTSIGEEGLDIGEIDMIACYDAQKTPIRMLQRIGRTGRKKDGYVHVLLSEEREERNWEKADDDYKNVQRFILRAEALELYGDVERLLPAHIKPECVEMVMEIEEYARVDPAKARAERLPPAKKRARNDDAMRNIPAGASTGFVSVKALLQKGKKRKKALEAVDFDHAAESDDDDRDIAAGILGPRRTASMPAEKPKAKRLKRSKTVAGGDEEGTGGKKKAKGKQKATQELPRFDELTSSQLERLGQDDSDDEDIALGLTLKKAATSKAKKGAAKNDKAGTSSQMTNSKRKKPPSPPPRPRTPTPPLHKGNSSRSTSIPEPTTPPEWSSSPARPLAKRDTLVLASPHMSPVVRTPSPEFEAPRWSSPDVAVSSVRKAAQAKSKSRSPLHSSPPVAGPSASASSRSITGDADEVNEGGGEAGDTSMAWLLADDSEPEIEFIGSSPPPERISKDPSRATFDDSSEVEVLPSSPVPAQREPSPVRQRSQSLEMSIEVPYEEPVAYTQSQSKSQPRPAASKFRPAGAASSTPANMPPPALPARFAEAPSPEPPHEVEDEVEADDIPVPSSDGPPPATFAVRGPVRAKKRVRVDSSPLATPSDAPRRLHRGSPPPRPRALSSSSPPPSPAPKRKRRRFADTRALARANPWLDVEAAHSGDERSDGAHEDGSGLSDGGSSDAAFAGDFAPTQAPAGYDQAAVYARSLLTQAGGAGGPVFARGPVRRGVLPVRRAARAGLPSSSPPQRDSEDEYEMGTFVVPDDEEIAYLQSSPILG